MHQAWLIQDTFESINKYLDFRDSTRLSTTNLQIHKYVSNHSKEKKMYFKKEPQLKWLKTHIRTLESAVFENIQKLDMALVKYYNVQLPKKVVLTNCTTAFEFPSPYGEYIMYPHVEELIIDGGSVNVNWKVLPNLKRLVIAKGFDLQIDKLKVCKNLEVLIWGENQFRVCTSFHTFFPKLKVFVLYGLYPNLEPDEEKQFNILIHQNRRRVLRTELKPFERHTLSQIEGALDFLTTINPNYLAPQFLL